MYKVVMQYPDGTNEEEDALFETEDEATEWALEQCSNYAAGGEVLHMSNPGDYPLSEDGADFDVIEVSG